MGSRSRGEASPPREYRGHRRAPIPSCQTGAGSGSDKRCVQRFPSSLARQSVIVVCTSTHRGAAHRDATRLSPDRAATSLLGRTGIPTCADAGQARADYRASSGGARSFASGSRSLRDEDGPAEYRGIGGVLPRRRIATAGRRASGECDTAQRSRSGVV